MESAFDGGGELPLKHPSPLGVTTVWDLPPARGSQRLLRQHLDKSVSCKTPPVDELRNTCATGGNVDAGGTEHDATIHSFVHLLIPAGARVNVGVHPGDTASPPAGTTVHKTRPRCRRVLRCDVCLFSELLFRLSISSREKFTMRSTRNPPLSAGRTPSRPSPLCRSSPSAQSSGSRHSGLLLQSP